MTSRKGRAYIISMILILKNTREQCCIYTDYTATQTSFSARTQLDFSFLQSSAYNLEVLSLPVLGVLGGKEERKKKKKKYE